MGLSVVFVVGGGFFVLIHIAFHDELQDDIGALLN